MLADALRFVMRAVHTGALAVWLGGGLLFFLTRPIVRPTASSEAWAAHERILRTLMNRCFLLLLGSGAYLVFDRLADTRVGALYVAALGVKLALVAAIAWVVSARRPSRAGASRRRLPGTAWLVLALGAGASILGVLLTVIYEAEAGRP